MSNDLQEAHPALWTRWGGLWARRETGESLALFRMACGLCVLYAVGSVALHGMVPVLWLDLSDGGYSPLPDQPWLFRLFGGLTPTSLWTTIAIALGSGLLLVLGLAGRLAALLALQTNMALADINSQTGGSDDYLLANALWLLVLARSTASLSVVCRWRTGRWSSAERIPAWPRYLAIYQLVLMYWCAGLHKLSATWIPGGDCSALYYILQQPSWQRWDMSWLAWVYPVTQAGTAITWLWEVTSPLLLLALWYHATPERPGRLRALFNRLHFRGLFVMVGLTMHVSLLVLMDLGPFSWVTLAYYFCLFPPEQWRTTWQRLWRRSHLKADDISTLQVSRWSDHAVAAFALFHLLAITLMALPSPGGSSLNRAAWQDPTVQEEFSEWTAHLKGWGLDVTAGDLEDFLWNTAVEYDAARQKALAPFLPYYNYCGTYQSWALFAAPQRYPTRLHIDVEEDGAWRLVYAERSSQYRWLGERLDFHRMRPLLFRHGWPGYDEDYRYFAHWIATQASRDFPAATRVRLRLFRYRTLTPEEVRRGQSAEGEFIKPMLVVLRPTALRHD